MLSAESTVMICTECNLLAELGGRDHQVDAHTQENNKQTRPCKETLCAQLVLGTALGPDVGGVDGRVAINVGAVLVGETVHTTVLACTNNLAIRTRGGNACRSNDVSRASGSPGDTSTPLPTDRQHHMKRHTAIHANQPGDCHVC